jgi:hypothetical protein
MTGIVVLWEKPQICSFIFAFFSGVSKDFYQQQHDRKFTFYTFGH